MAIEAVVTGNLLAMPEQRMVVVRGDESVKVTEFAIMSDEWVGRGDEMKQNDAKTQPVRFTIWNERLGEQVMRLYKTGMRLQVSCDGLYLHQWTPNDEQAAQGKKQVHELRADARTVALLPNRVEQVVMRAKAEGSASA